MGMKFTPETIQYLFDEKTRDAANAINSGEKSWLKAKPIEAIAAEVIESAEKGDFCAYWVIFKGSEKEAMEARKTLEELGMAVEDYYWHDDDKYGTAGGRMNVYFSHLLV